MTAATGHPATQVNAPRHDDTPTLGEWLSALGHAVAASMHRAQAASRLQRLDDRTLKDIGLHRTEISSIVRHGAGDPTRLPR